ncbi:putative ribonuclease H-like domain-containing protein [Tanacetum coccineum]
MPESVVNEPKVVSQPKVWTDAPIIEEYESDSDDEHVSLPSKEQETPSFANTIKHVKTPRQTVKQQNTCSKSPKPDKKDCSGLMSKKLGLGYGFTKKACFVCGSFSHLIRDCDFHEKRMAKQAEVNKRKCKGTGQRENRPVWNNVNRVNHQNQFVPTAVLTSLVLTNFNSQVVPTNAVRKVNTVKPIVNTAEVKSVSTVGGKWETAVKPLAALKNKGIIDSGCSRHMTGNKAHLAEYQDYNVGPFAFGSSKGYITGKGPTWLFDLDYLTDLMNYQPVRSENLAKLICRSKEADQMQAQKLLLMHVIIKRVNSAQDYFCTAIWSSYSSTVKRVDKEDQVFLDELERLKRQEQDANDAAEALRKEFAQETEDLLLQAGAAKASSTNIVNTASTPVSTASPYGGLSFTDLTNPDQDDSEIPALEEIYDNPTDGIFTNSSYDDEGAVADFTNLEPVVNVSPIPTSRINSIHPSTQILGDPQSAVQTRSKVTKSSRAHAFVSYIQKQRRNNHKDFQHCLFACFLSQNEPKKISEALEDESWVDAMQEELLQFKIQKVWILVDLPYGKKAIGTKWVYRNRGWRVYQIGWEKVPSCMEKIDEEVLCVATYRICRSLSILDGLQSSRKALIGLHQAPRAWYATLSTFLLKNGYRRGTIDKTLFIKKDKHDIILMSSMGELTFFLGLQVQQKEDGIFISQDKYVAEIMKKFDFVSVKTASTPIETQKPLVKDEEASDVDVHLYRSMIGSLMYLTASR